MSGSLTHSPSAILRQLLVDLSLGTDPADEGIWPVYQGREPDTPDKTITTYDTEGVQDGRTMVGGRVYEHHGSQIRVRAANEPTAFEKAREIAVDLDEGEYYVAVTISTSTYLVQSISRVSGPLSIGKEPNSQRNLITINVKMAIRQTN